MIAERVSEHAFEHLHQPSYKNNSYDRLNCLVISSGLELDRFLKLEEKSRTWIKRTIKFLEYGSSRDTYSIGLPFRYDHGP